MKLRERIGRAVARIAQPYLKEALDDYTSFDVPIDSDDGLFRSLQQTSRDFSPHKYERSVKISQYLYESDPLYKRIINFPLEASSAAGFKFDSDNEVLQERWKEFWLHPITGWRFKFMGTDGLFREFMLAGEINLPFAPLNNGDLDIGFIEPVNIKQVRKVPGNALIDDKIKLKDKNGRDGRSFDVVRSVAGTLFGDVFRFCLNKPLNAMRGKPLHLAIVDYVDLNQQAMWNELERWKALKAHLWQLKTGMTAEQVKDFHREMLKNGQDVIDAGQIRVVDKDSEWSAITPDLKASDSSEMAKLFRNFVGGASVGNGAILGFGEDINVSTMRELMKIVVWVVEGMQKRMAEVLTYIFAYQVQSDSQVGRATGAGIMTDMDLEFEIKPNRIIKRDFMVEATGFQAISTAITTAVSSQIIAKRTARKQYAMASQEFDFEITEQEIEEDWEAEEEERNEEERNRQMDAFDNPFNQDMTPAEMDLKMSKKRRRKYA